MRLNQLPNFRTEDFPGEQSWTTKLFVQLNPFVQAVANLFENNIDFATNIKSITRTYTISSFQAFSFSWPYGQTAPNCLEVLNAKKGSTQTPTILLAAWSYDATTQTITVSRLTEVNEATVSALSGTYQFTIRVTV